MLPDLTPYTQDFKSREMPPFIIYPHPGVSWGVPRHSLLLAVRVPKGWPIGRKRQYFDWAKKVIDQLRGTNPKLERRFDGLYRKKLAAERLPEGLR